MTMPCEQAVNIATISTTLDHVVTLLEKHEAREERMLDSIEVVAVQAEILKSLAETNHRQEKEIDELYHLIRGHLEEKDNTNLTCKLMHSEVGKYFLGAIVIGTLIDIYAHGEVIKYIINIFGL